MDTLIRKALEPLLISLLSDLGKARLGEIMQEIESPEALVQRFFDSPEEAVAFGQRLKDLGNLFLVSGAAIEFAVRNLEEGTRER